MQSKTIIDLLNNEKTNHFIGEHINDDIKILALSGDRYPKIDIKAVSGIISLYQKAILKLPEHYKKRAAFNAKSYEQCTSEIVALFKSSIMDISGKSIINISGGIGIDDWAMAQTAEKIDSCDLDEEVHMMANYNIGLFGHHNIERHLIDGIKFIEDNSKTDIIYADPDRRPASKKVFRLEDCEPDILSHLNILIEKSDKLWLKISPMADISYIQKSLPTISKLYVIALMGEVKEILVCCEGKASVTKEERLEEVYAVNIGINKTHIFKKRENAAPPGYSNAGKYLYEPNKSIIKAGLSADYAEYLKIEMLDSNSHFLISDQHMFDFQGRTFQIIIKILYKPKLIKEYLETESISKVNIITRNFRETTDDLWKRFKLKVGGDVYLCFTTDSQNQCWMYHCKQIYG